MKPKFTYLLFVIGFSLVFSGAANAKGISFTKREKNNHKKYASRIVKKSAKCLENVWQDHVRFHTKWGFSKFYGDQNTSLNTRNKRLSALKNIGAPLKLIDELVSTSCIVLSVRCLGEGFNNVGDATSKKSWKKIRRYVYDNGTTGIYLLKGLQALGWKVMFWNPIPANNALWDAEDPRIKPGMPASWDTGVRDSNGKFIFHPAWGMHGLRYKSVMKRKRYYKVSVDDRSTLVDFGFDVPDEFTEIPFFVGVAHAGYHVFPGYYGRVIEAHSTRKLSSITNIENSEFNPLASGGGPRWSRSEKYRSGVIGVPPGEL